MRELRFVNVSVLWFLLATLNLSSAAEAPAPRTLKELIAKAKESNHTITHGCLGGYGCGSCQSQRKGIREKIRFSSSDRIATGASP